MRPCLRLAPILAVALAGCATVLPRPPVAVARNQSPGPLAWRILDGVQRSAVLADFDRDMTFGPDTVRLELVRPGEDGGRQVLLLRLVPGRARTEVFASGWREDARGRSRRDPAVVGSLSVLLRVVRHAAGRRVAVAIP